MELHEGHNLTRVLEAVTLQPWVMEPIKYRALVDIVMAHAEGCLIDREALAAYRAESKPAQSMVEYYPGLAVVNINGAMVRRGNMLSEMSGATSYAQIQKAFNEAMASEADRVVLNFDSPGGEVMGIEETADLIYNAKQNTDKYLTAYTSGNMTSGAQWLASQCDETLCSSDAILGSVGVISTIADNSGQLEKAGIKLHVLRTGMNKGVGVGEVTEEQLAQYIAIRDAAFSTFVSAMQRGRQMQMSHDVLSGRIYRGDAAVAAGLADGTMSWEALLGKYTKK